MNEKNTREFIEDGTFDEFIPKSVSSEQIQAAIQAAIEKYIVSRLRAGLEETNSASAAGAFLKELRSEVVSRGRLSDAQRELQNRVQRVLSKRLEQEAGVSPADANGMVGPLAAKIARRLPPNRWDSPLSSGLGNQLVDEVRRLRQPPASLTPRMVGIVLPKMDPSQVDSIFADPYLPKEIKRTIAGQVMQAKDLETATARALRMVKQWKKEESAAGLEEAQVPERVVEVYAQPAVGAGALSLVPKEWKLGQVRALSEDPKKANAGLEEAARKAEQGRLVLVVVDAAFKAGLKLPPKAVVVVLDPTTMDRVDWRAAAAYLGQPQRLFGLLMDLTTGSFLFMELPAPASSEPLRQAA